MVWLSEWVTLTVAIWVFGSLCTRAPGPRPPAANCRHGRAELWAVFFCTHSDNNVHCIIRRTESDSDEIEPPGQCAGTLLCESPKCSLCCIFRPWFTMGMGQVSCLLGDNEEVTQVLTVLVMGYFSFLHSCTFLIAFMMTYFCSDKEYSEMYRWP